ncbi:uncharacterized protein LOC134785562 [Penaeus indicus]|uniref:uncharacterized protein LOC134785562 n=1 Tax=Penaeus indicus TaxID=29960 RepID=UPI00300C0722
MVMSTIIETTVHHFHNNGFGGPCCDNVCDYGLRGSVKETSEHSTQLKFRMARNVAVTSFLVALCFVAAVAGHRSYGSGGHRPLGVHGSVHSSAGIHGGSAHGVGLVGSGIHGAGSFGAGSFGAGSFNPAHFPGLVPGFGFHLNQPASGYNKCKYWCKSSYTNQYYCCQQSFYG